ncbi:MAG: ATP-binding protein [Alphaproteobacteria bacterium]
MTVFASSPASSGPAGAHFEGQVGATYMLTMLVGAEPRGLPGTKIDSIKLQRAAEGRPLDDVIIHAHDARGNRAVLEIQVKRSISFAPSDDVFRAVMDQVATAALRSDFWNTRYELAVATAQTSRKIAGPYQDVLTWARQLDAVTFISRISRQGSANEDMRTFVRTVRTHLGAANVPDDDETVWGILRRFQILTFDLTATGSAHENYAIERAAHALNDNDTSQARKLWKALVELTLQIAVSGGQRTRTDLIEDFRRLSFRLAGERRYTTTRALIAEASRQALADIDDRVLDAKLSRHKHTASIRTAFDEARYVEIRGDAGVGKSGLLKHIAEQFTAEARIIVLAPARVIPRGWAAMRATLDFDGTAIELLIDLATDGGALLCIDNLDLFSNEERRTVVDLVHAAAEVPGLNVIATARRRFGIEDSSWLPKDALNLLGQAEPILVGELDEDEVDELRDAAPDLAALLSNSHPARGITRNLFRLTRLVGQARNAPMPRSEIDMAEQWWRMADGRRDSGHRERARLLQELAKQALTCTETFDVSNHPAEAVEALIASETLRDLGNDQVRFHHDVLCEWAIANHLTIEHSSINQLPLERPAPALLARGVELTARFALERSTDGAQWKALLDRLSCDGAHGSWRQAALLGLIHSEIATELLPRVSRILLAKQAAHLRELIRLTMAVDSEPFRDFLARTGIDSDLSLVGLTRPNGPSWSRLILWLLAIDEKLPAAAIPDVVDLYHSWSIGMMGADRLTPMVLRWIYRWLFEIEESRDVDGFAMRRQPFDGELEHDRLVPLERGLRLAFSQFSHRVPDLAQQYLRELSRRRRNEDACREILRFRGSLAQAAPLELAELTASTLIAKPSRREHRRRDRLGEKALTHVDNNFLPESPAQGPFFELLTHSPEHGLLLIRQLIDHVISFQTEGNTFGSDAFTISFADGDRTFPWVHTYTWARGGHCYSITSALMALEAWGHRRIEAGETFDVVLKDILGEAGAPAAYVLVALDLLLSHWPKSDEAAVPFLGCPELLCFDLQRYASDNIQEPDFFGLRGLQSEPSGVVSVDELKSRPSRRFTLTKILSDYILDHRAELRDALTTSLQRAKERLPDPDETSDLSDPSFMVVHGLNLIDPGNYQSVTVELADGTKAEARQYVSPSDEDQHFRALGEASKDEFADTNMHAALGIVVNNASRSSPELVQAAISWAQKATEARHEDEPAEASIRERSIVAAAMIAMRDGGPDIRAQHREWATKILDRALQVDSISTPWADADLSINTVAIAFVGKVYALRQHAAEDVHDLLDILSRSNASAAPGLGATLSVLLGIDDRLARAVLRVALGSCIHPKRNWDLDSTAEAARADWNRRRIDLIVAEEIAWLNGNGLEPNWPTFPIDGPRTRRKPRLRLEQNSSEQRPQPRASSDEFVDYQAASLWIENGARSIDGQVKPWSREIIRAYSAWTIAANGADLDDDDEATSIPHEWNNVYFALLARCLPGMSPGEIEDLVTRSIAMIPDEQFFDVASQLLRVGDEVFFEDDAINECTALAIRSAIADRLIESSRFRRLKGSRSTGIDMHLVPVVAVLFFSDHSFSQPPACYLRDPAINRLRPFFPVLNRIIESGPSLYVAILVLNLLEIAPRSDQLSFMIAATRVWLMSFPDDSVFWVDHDIGRRVCAWLGSVCCQQSNAFVIGASERSELDRILSALVTLGVPDARRLETALAKQG